MRTKGPVYWIRDGVEEWGKFRLTTIAALIHVGKATDRLQVRPDGATGWMPIGQDPSLALLLSNGGDVDALPDEGAAGAPSSVAPAAGAAQSASIPRSTLPAPAAAGPPAGITPPGAAPATPPPPGPPAGPLQGRAPGAGQPLAASPAPARPVSPAPRSSPQSSYKVICSDGAMLGPLPLVHLLARVWDGRVTPQDLVSVNDGPWVPCESISELAAGFAKAGAAAPEAPVAAPASAAVAPARPVLSPPPASPAGAPMAGPPRRLTPSPRPVALGAGLVPPPPQGPLAIPPDGGDDDDATNVVSVDRLLRGTPPPELDSAPARAAAPAGPPPSFEGRFEAVALPKVLGRLLRGHASGRLVLNGPFEVTLQVSGGRIVGAAGVPESEGLSLRVARTLSVPESMVQVASSVGADSLLLGLEQTGGIDDLGAKRFASLLAFESAVLPFAWRSGSFQFFEGAPEGGVEFWLTPWEFLRTGLLSGYDTAELERLVQGWNQAAAQAGPALAGLLGAGALLAPDERAVLELVDGGRVAGDLMEEAERLGVSRVVALSTLFMAYHLGAMTLAAGRSVSSARAAASDLFDPSQPIESLVSVAETTDYFTLLALGRGPETESPGTVDAAFRRAKEQVRILPGDPSQVARIVARLEAAHRCLSDPQRRAAYLAGGEEAVTALEGAAPDLGDSGVRIHTTETLAAPRSLPEEAPELEESAPRRSRTPSPAGRTRTPGPRAATPVRTQSNLEVLTAQNFEQAQKLISARKFKESLSILRNLIKVDPTDGRFQTYQAWAIYQDSRRKAADQQTALRALELALRLDRTLAVAHYFAAQVHADAGVPTKAKSSLARALEIDPNLSEAKSLEAALVESAAPTALRDRKRLPLALLLTALVFGAFFYVANFLGHDPHAAVDGFGAEEGYYHLGAWLFYARRGALLLLGLLGSYVLLKPERPKNLIGFSLLGLLYGAAFGYISSGMYPLRFPRGELPDIQVAMALVLFHAVAEEHFFRGFVTRSLLPWFHSLLPATVASGLLYGIYHLSYVSFWWGLHYFHPGQLLGSMPTQVVNVAITMGIPLAWLFAKSRSVVPGILAQVAFGWVFVLLSILSASGV